MNGQANNWVTENQEVFLNFSGRSAASKSLFLLLECGVISFLFYIGFSVVNILTLNSSPTPMPKIERMIEAEGLYVVGKNRDFPYFRQDMTNYGGHWSQGHQMLAANTKVGDWVKYLLLAREGHYKLVLYLTQADDYGIIQISINGSTIGDPIDLYSQSGDVRSTGPIPIGDFNIREGRNILQIKVVSRNPNNKNNGNQFGFDGIILETVQ